jgi:hypothetical protein
MNGLQRTRLSRNLDGSGDEPQWAGSGPASQETGLVLVYPDRCYADHKGRALLSRLRQHLPRDQYRGALPVRIMECCREVRNRVSVDRPVQLQMTGAFELGEQTLRVRVLSLPLQRPGDRAPILVLLDVMRRTEATNAPNSQ